MLGGHLPLQERKMYFSNCLSEAAFKRQPSLLVVSASPKVHLLPEAACTQLFTDMEV